VTAATGIPDEPLTYYMGTPGGGVWKTIDAGATWTRLEGGLPDGVVGRVGIAVSPVNSDRVWVIQESVDKTNGGIYILKPPFLCLISMDDKYLNPCIDR